jgi:hypothetical protein
MSPLQKCRHLASRASLFLFGPLSLVRCPRPRPGPWFVVLGPWSVAGGGGRVSKPLSTPQPPYTRYMSALCLLYFKIERVSGGHAAPIEETSSRSQPKSDLRAPEHRSTAAWQLTLQPPKNPGCAPAPSSPAFLARVGAHQPNSRNSLQIKATFGDSWAAEE